MLGVVQQLNRGLLLSRRFHGGPPPYMYRKAWRNLLTISSSLQGALPDSLQCKLEGALQMLLNIDNKDFVEAASYLEDLTDDLAAQSGNRIPQAEADALFAAVRQIAMFAHCQPF